MSDLSTKQYPQRTLQQNKAQHVWMNLLADDLNQHGLHMRRVFAVMNDGFDIPWTMEAVKEYIVRPIMKAQFAKQSTTKLTTKEINELYETVAKMMAERFGLETEFPSIEHILQELNQEKRG